MTIVPDSEDDFVPDVDELEGLIPDIHDERNAPRAIAPPAPDTGRTALLARWLELDRDQPMRIFSVHWPKGTSAAALDALIAESRRLRALPHGDPPDGVSTNFYACGPFFYDLSLVRWEVFTRLPPSVVLALVSRLGGVISSVNEMAR